MRVVLFLFIMQASSAFAQTDSLLGYPGSIQSKESNRYKVKQITVETTTTTKTAPPKQKTAPVAEPPLTIRPVPEVVVEAPKTETVAAPSTETPPTTIDWRSLLNEQDIRRNIFELNFSPIFFYNDSSSSYSYRDYHSSNLGLDLDAHIWFTPFLGLEVGYTQSIASGIGSGASASKATHEWLSAGLEYRHFFGLSRQLPFITGGLGYKEYQLRVPSDDPNRMRQKTQGLDIHVEGEFPVSNSYSWILGSTFMPAPSHNESATGIDAASGSGEDSVAWEFYIGGNFNFDRKSRIFWRVRQDYYRYQFSGSASAVDPRTNQTPSGVSVNNSFTMFQFGYLLGF